MRWAWVYCGGSVGASAGACGAPCDAWGNGCNGLTDVMGVTAHHVARRVALSLPARHKAEEGREGLVGSAHEAFLMERIKEVKAHRAAMQPEEGGARIAVAGVAAEEEKRRTVGVQGVLIEGGREGRGFGHLFARRLVGVRAAFAKQHELRDHHVVKPLEEDGAVA